MSKPIYSMKNYVVKNDNKKVLNINKFDFHRGVCYVVSGKCSSGKTLFLDSLAGNLKTGEGLIKYEGTELSKMKKYQLAQEICYMQQETRRGWGTAERYLVKYLSRYEHISDIKKAYMNILGKMDLKYMLPLKVRKLTMGQFRLLQIVAAIAADTKVLIIDGIDISVSQYELTNIAKILYRKSHYDGVTVILSCYNKSQLSKLGNVFIQFDAGRIVGIRSSDRRDDRRPRSRPRQRRKNNQPKKS